MDDPQSPQPHEPHRVAPEMPKPKKIGMWQKMGGNSLTFAIVLHAVFLLIGAFWVIQVIKEPEKKVDFLPGGGGGGGERGVQVQQKRQKQITPSTNVKRVFAEGAQSSFAIPDPGDSFGEMSSLSSLAGGGLSGGGLGGGSGGPGRGMGSGMGLGGGGAGKLFGLIPETMRKRCSKEDRLQRLRENGGTPACETAVLQGLRWLKQNQNPDGSWGIHKRPGLTGLALLAYFGHCETPASEEFGDSCTKAIAYLVNLGMKEGDEKTKFTLTEEAAEKTWPYENAIATYALAEAFTFCKELKINIPNLEEVVLGAGQFIIDNQDVSGGWDYYYRMNDTSPDVSHTGWHLQALKACSHTKLNFSGMQKAVDRALAFIQDCQDSQGGIGYTKRKKPITGLDYYSLTGKGLLCLQMWGRGDSANAKRALDYILANSKFDYEGADSDLYCHYYESQAMMWAGGQYWKQYNEMIRDELLQNQNPDGSWKSPGENVPRINAVLAHYRDTFKGDLNFTNKDSAILRTSLCTLMLEVYYRFLSTGGGGGIRGRPGI